MTPRERFLKVLNFEKPDDRLPMVEWAPWWDKTMERWKGEGLPAGMTWEESLRHFGLDPLLMINGSAISSECPRPSSYGAPIITDEKSYQEIKQYLYTDSIIENMKRTAMALKEKHDK